MDEVAVIRRLMEAFNARDVDTMLALIDPAAELYPMRAQLEGKAYRGHDGLRKLLEELDEDWDYVRMDADEFREAGDQLVVFGHLRSRGRASGVDVDVPMGWVWKVRSGKAVYAKAYSEQADALRAGGLE